MNKIMKTYLTFNKWSFYLMLALCVGFISCSDDDDEGNGGGSGGSLGSTITITEDDETGEVKISYDKQGRVSKIVGKWYDEYGDIEEMETSTYTYSSDEITVVEIVQEDGDSYSETTVYELDNRGLICASYGYYDGYGSKYVYYEYDGNKRLISYGTASYMNPVQWDEENILTEYEYHTGYDYYTNKLDEKGLNGLEYGFTDDYGVLYMQGYFGKKSANLLKSHSGGSYTYTWDGDKVKTMTGVYYDSYYGEERWTYTFNF